ncbi:transmembrane protein 238 [Electrophorus electricus]|uniref:transmembrane protein 238 n=1 Tax=Electrophorus electricus TaxID=8005 RepID=UPI000F09FA8E|nr:transmembrane protein 238 [Electrophorus electricus]XP_035387037.1 transmembrane protein 238 [Electrophorus electricus]
MEEVFGSLGRCSCAFWLAVAFDVFGLIILLVGVFADLFFYDFLIYAGAIIIFLSLIWWVFWYTGNISVPPEDLEDDVGLLKKDRGFVGVLRRMSSRLSNGIRNSIRRNGTTGGQGTMPGHSAHRRHGARQVPVTLPMTPQEDVKTVSATVVGESPVPDSRVAETSAI